MILRSKYLVCSPTEVIENGAVSITPNGKIDAAGTFSEVKRSQSGKIVDLGDEILAPGFVNAHTHMALTAVKDSVPETASFCEWLFHVTTATQHWEEDDYFDSVMAGVNMSLEGGSTTVVDIAGSDHAIGALRLSGIRKYMLFEVIGFDPATTQECIGLCEDRLAEWREEELQRTGIAPHSPYSVSAELLIFCRDKATALDKVLSLHLAETQQEIEFIDTGAGEIRDFKERLGLPANDWSGRGMSPVQYAADLGLLMRRSLLAHCNYLTEEDIQTLAASKATVVYCPRSHRYFGHSLHPLPKLLEAGVPVALGTDSLASNDGLSMLAEMKVVQDRFPSLSAEAIFGMATTAAAPALGAIGAIGVIKREANADIISIRPGEGEDVLEKILDNDSEVTLNMIGGRILFDRHAGMKDKQSH